MIQNMSIDQLLPLCKEKDQRAQLEVYQRYHLAMYHSALRIVRNPVDAEDIMHEGFLTAFEKLAQYKGDNKFSGWLKQIVIRKAFKSGGFWLYSIGDRIAGFLLTRVNMIAPSTKKRVKKMME